MVEKAGMAKIFFRVLRVSLPVLFHEREMVLACDWWKIAHLNVTVNQRYSFIH
jgi:hypothetical protein